MDPYPFEVCGARDLVEARLRRWASRYPSPETAIRVLSALVPLGTLRQAADDLGLFDDLPPSDGDEGGQYGDLR